MVQMFFTPEENLRAMALNQDPSKKDLLKTALEAWIDTPIDERGPLGDVLDSVENA